MDEPQSHSSQARTPRSSKPSTRAFNIRWGMETEPFPSLPKKKMLCLPTYSRALRPAKRSKQHKRKCQTKPSLFPSGKQKTKERPSERFPGVSELFLAQQPDAAGSPIRLGWLARAA